MRIALFGKFPPIQGGVSSDVYEFCGAAVAAGHEIHVITNADEAEAGVRAVLTETDQDRLTHGGSVRVHSTKSLGPRIYIPYANPFLSKLLGLGRQVFAQYSFDLALGWYLEPYALAAALTVQQRQIPLFVKTAGSDIGKLATHPDLRHAYSIAFERADCVFVGRSETARATMEGLGSRPNRMVSLRTSTLPRSFTRTAEPVPLDWRAQLSAAAATTAGAERALVSHYLQQNDGGALDPKAPTIGVYGKVGETKGTYDLLAALSGLALEGVKFNLLWMPAGTPERLKPFFRCINELRAQHGWIQVLPPLPPWKVPGFLARCDLTCVLERRFPVEFHGPRLPREVLASGSALVISREVAAKQSFASNLVHLKNCVLIENPSDTEELKSALGQVLSDASLRTYIRRHGQYLSKTVEPFLEAGHSVLNAIEDLMSELTDRDAGAMLPVDRRR